MFLHFYHFSAPKFSQFGNNIWSLISRILLVSIIPFVRIHKDNLFEIFIVLKKLSMSSKNKFNISCFYFPKSFIFFVLTIRRVQKNDSFLTTKRFIRHHRHRPKIRKNHQNLSLFYKGRKIGNIRNH